MSENELKANKVTWADAIDMARVVNGEQIHCTVCGALGFSNPCGKCFENPLSAELTQLKQQLKKTRAVWLGKAESLAEEAQIAKQQLAAKTEELERVQTQVEKMRNALLEVQYGGDDECIACGRCVCCSNDCVISNALSPITPTTEQSSAVPTCKDGLQVGETNLEKKEN